MLIDCPQMTQYRNSCGLGPFIAAYRSTKTHLSSVKIYAMYLNDSFPDIINKKTLDLYHMYLGWHNLMKIEI